MKGYTREIDKLEDVPCKILDELISCIERDTITAIKDNREQCFLDSPYEGYNVGYCLYYEPLDRFYSFQIDIVAEPTDGYQIINVTPKKFNRFYWKMHRGAWCWGDMPRMQTYYKNGRNFPVGEFFTRLLQDDTTTIGEKEIK